MADTEKIPKKKKIGAPKGNKYAVGNNGGRPSMFDSPEEMQIKIDEYFTDCPDKKTIITKNGDSINIPAITITGLCVFLGFESRQSFYAYEDKVEFNYIIKKARLRIENYYEQCLQFGNVIGAIFPLKNMGWHDKTETEHTGIPQSLTITVDDSKTAQILKQLKDEFSKIN